MAAQEIVLKFRGDPSQIKEVLSDVRSAYGRTLTEIVGVSKDINAQINAMWAQRGREISAELTKELEIERAYAQAEVQSSTAAQREIVAAYKQRERDAAAIARSEAAEWARHEAQELAATKRAEKEGEAIVASANAQKAKSSKQTESQRARDTRAALADIARMERERTTIVAQNSRAITALAKTEADTRIREGRRTANELINQLKQTASERLAIERRLSSGGGGSAFLAGAVGGVTALVGVSAVSEIRQAATAWLDYSSKLETTRIAFTTMLGSAQLAETHLKELQQFALKTPFQFGELIDASQRMQALGFRAEQVIPILTDVGNAVAAAGGGSERLDRVTLALSQIQSKGKVMTQELNQLAEAGIPAFRILQQELGKSRSEINELTKDGQISSKVFLDAFQKFSQQNFGGLMEQQSKTFSGAMSNIKDALLQTSATAFEPLYQKLSQLAKAFADSATSSQDFRDKLKVVGGTTTTIFDGLVEVILAFRDAIRIAFAAVSGQIHVLIEGFTALAHATAAAFFAAFAATKIAQGDFVGAARAQRVAQEELKLATDAAKRAIVAQGEALRAVVSVYKEAEARAKALSDAQATVGVDVGVGAGILRKKTTDTDTEDLTKKTKGSDPAAAARRIAEIQLRAVLDSLQLEEEGIERSLRRRTVEYAKYVARVELLENQRHQAVIGGLIGEQRAANQLRDINAQRVANAEIEARRTQENNKHQSELNKLSDKTFERDKQIQDSLTAFREKQIEQLRQIVEGNKTALDEARDFIVAFEKMGGVLDENQKKWLQFDAILISSKEHMQDLAETLREAAQEGLGPPTPVFPTLTPEQIEASAGAVANAGAGIAPHVAGTRSAIDQLFEAINNNLAGDTQSAALAGLEAMTEAFQGLGSAVGQVVESFVLYGSAGTSVRKVTAEILAGVARQAAIKAVFELAEGFAALALAFFGLPNAGPSASAHFTAAAIYAGVAGIAALAGRGVAGNAFQKSVGGGTSGSGAGAAGSRTTTNTGQPKTVELDRATQNQQAITLNVNVKRDAGSIVEVVVDDHRNNGPIRQMVLSEVGG